METGILLWIRAQASPTLDAVARVSWALGALRFCAPAVLLLAARHLARRERREALAWLAVGAAAGLVPELVKAAAAHPRPALWPWLLPTSGYSFPSGHAIAGAWPSDDPVDRVMGLDMQTYLPDDLLRMGDRISMKHSLQLRVPFCDHFLIGLAKSIPSTQHLNGWTQVIVEEFSGGTAPASGT